MIVSRQKTIKSVLSYLINNAHTPKEPEITREEAEELIPNSIVFPLEVLCKKHHLFLLNFLIVAVSDSKYKHFICKEKSRYVVK